MALFRSTLVSCVKKNAMVQNMTVRSMGLFDKWFDDNYGLPPGKHKALPEAIEHATGEEKRVLMLMEKGIDDPYYRKAMKRGPGTKDNPNLVPSFEPRRMIGCVCEEDATCINWLWLHKGEPKRCECGYWFKCVDAHDHFADVEKELDERGMFHKQ